MNNISEKIQNQCQGESQPNQVWNNGFLNAGVERKFAAGFKNHLGHNIYFLDMKLYVLHFVCDNLKLQIYFSLTFLHPTKQVTRKYRNKRLVLFKIIQCITGLALHLRHVRLYN